MAQRPLAIALTKLFKLARQGVLEGSDDLPGLDGGLEPEARRPESTVFVMENFAVPVDAAGNPRTGADGKLVKGDLVRVFVMAKGLGYGTDLPKELRTGDWVFASYDAKGAKTADNLAGCRGCHIPLASSDFVFRVDEYQAARAKSGY